jgi:hypothetical protein
MDALHCWFLALGILSGRIARTKSKISPMQQSDPTIEAITNLIAFIPNAQRHSPTLYNPSNRSIYIMATSRSVTPGTASAVPSRASSRPGPPGLP